MTEKKGEEREPYFKKVEAAKAEGQKRAFAKGQSKGREVRMSPEQYALAEKTIHLSQDAAFKELMNHMMTLKAVSLQNAFTTYHVDREGNTVLKTYGEQVATNEGFALGISSVINEINGLWQAYMNIKEKEQKGD